MFTAFGSNPLGSDGVLTHRLDEHEPQPEMIVDAARQDLESLNTQTADAVLRRHDAAIERELFAVFQHLRLQVRERLLDVRIGLAIHLPRQLRGRHLGPKLCVRVFERLDLRRQLAAILELGELAVAAFEPAPLVDAVDQ